MNKQDDTIFTSQSLTEEMNRKRRKKGLPEIDPINSMRGSTNTIARKDKSWSSVPDFFRQLFRKK